jgi:hypothetical protein
MESPEKILAEPMTSAPACSSPTSLPLVHPPGCMIPLDHLPSDHHAVMYLQRRGYDPVLLAEFWGVAYCAYSAFKGLRGRLYVPISQNSILVGWQGRWPGDLDWDAKGISKYYTMPGLRKGQLLYNLDLARQQPLVVVCEGVTDVWSVGSAGVALFGKKVAGNSCVSWSSTGPTSLLWCCWMPMLPRKPEYSVLNFSLSSRGVWSAHDFPRDSIRAVALGGNYGHSCTRQRQTRECRFLHRSISLPQNA